MLHALNNSNTITFKLFGIKYFFKNCCFGFFKFIFTFAASVFRSPTLSSAQHSVLYIWVITAWPTSNFLSLCNSSENDYIMTGEACLTALSLHHKEKETKHSMLLNSPRQKITSKENNGFYSAGLLRHRGCVRKIYKNC